MEMNFCRRCGKQLLIVSSHVYRCDEGHVIFANCSPSVGVFFVTHDDNVLFAVRGQEPRKGMLDAFGGFADGEETFEDAIKRELDEELRLKPHEYTTPQYLASGIGHYDYKGESIPVLSALFWARLKTDRELVAADDISGVFSFHKSSIDLSRMHDEDIRTGVRKLIEVLK